MLLTLSTPGTHFALFVLHILSTTDTHSPLFVLLTLGTIGTNFPLFVLLTLSTTDTLLSICPADPQYNWDTFPSIYIAHQSN